MSRRRRVGDLVKSRGDLYREFKCGFDVFWHVYGIYKFKVGLVQMRAEN